MLADHLGTGDYAITRAVFAAVVVVAIVVAVVSIAKSDAWIRIIGCALSVTLLFVAVRMHFRWEYITDFADHLTGPSGGEFRLSELDDFVGSIFGRLYFLLASLAAMLVAAVVMNRHSVDDPLVEVR